MTERIGNDYERHMMVHWWKSCQSAKDNDKFSYVWHQWENDEKCTGKCPTINSVKKYLKNLEINNIKDRRKERKNDNLATKCNPINCEIFVNIVENCRGKISYADIARTMNCSEPSVAKIAHKLGYRLFSPVLTGIVPPSAIPVRMKFAETFLKALENEPHFHRKIWFTDESHFDTLEELNQKIISKERPSLEVSGVQKERFPKDSLFWGAMHYEYGLIWFTNFLNAKGNYGNVDQFNYHDCLLYFTGELRSRYTQEQINEMWFQQDGASCHTAFNSRAFLFSFFGERVIDRKSEGDNSLGLFWPPFSCFLNPCDYTLWPKLKKPVRKQWEEVPKGCR